MSRPCSICTSPTRQAVDAALLAGEPYRDIAARCPGISRSALSRHRAHLLPTAPFPTVAGGWQLVLADPPWRFEVRSRDTGLGRAADAHYATMTLEEICALPVRRIVARDAILLLWTTWPHLETARFVGRAWGFRYSTGYVWDKELPGTGFVFRGQTEPCLLFTRGRPGVLPAVRDVPNLLRERRREHSRKPDGQYARIDRMWPHLPRRLELFARTAWPGWAAWGREVGRFEAPPLGLEEAAG